MELLFSSQQGSTSQKTRISSFTVATSSISKAIPLCHELIFMSFIETVPEGGLVVVVLAFRRMIFFFSGCNNFQFIVTPFIIPTNPFPCA